MSVNEFYDSQRSEWEKDITNAEREAIHVSWLQPDTVDSWRHRRMYEAASSLAHLPHLTWLTIGDGRFGLDAIRIRSLGFRTIMPSDISGVLLEQARARGLIEEYAVENAESLSFSTNSFDVVFCKESYHHFPRPALALYEMLRVARKAVILVEPRDYLIDHGPQRVVGPIGLVKGFMLWCRDKLNLPHRSVSAAGLFLTGDQPRYEKSGNYMFTVSSRELEKVALGINLPGLALKGLNDEYIAGAETEPASAGSTVYRRLRGRLKTADRRSQAGFGSTSLLMAMLFKVTPDDVTKAFLRQNEWNYSDLPRNPYVKPV